MEKHLVVISVDAMVFEDLEYLKDCPNFKRLLDGAAVIERVKTIYPSVTHAVHATMITGATPGVTGIINNHIFKPAAPDTDTWQWYNILSEVKCDTLLHAAKRAGLTTASSTWPMVSCAADVVDYLVPSALNYCFIGHEDDRHNCRGGKKIRNYRPSPRVRPVPDLLRRRDHQEIQAQSAAHPPR